RVALALALLIEERSGCPPVQRGLGRLGHVVRNGPGERHLVGHRPSLSRSAMMPSLAWRSAPSWPHTRAAASAYATHGSGGTFACRAISATRSRWVGVRSSRQR